MEAWHRRGGDVVSVLQAPLGAIARTRRPLRPGHVLVTLEDLAIVTWTIAEPTLRSHLPVGIRPVIRQGHAFVSAVLFRNRALRPAVFGVPRMDSCQMNLRSYIFDPISGGPDSLFFHGLYLSRRWLARMSSWLFGVPFQHLPLTIRARVDGDHISEYEATSSDDRIEIRAHGADQAVDEETLGLLTNPHTGYVLDRGRVLRCWSIWHQPQSVHTMAVGRAAIEFAGLPPLGLPQWAFYVPSIDYEVYLPPTAVMNRSLMPT
jgi:uncharacterized protein YqjF (DUF2071 family)